MRHQPMFFRFLLLPLLLHPYINLGFKDAPLIMVFDFEMCYQSHHCLPLSFRKPGVIVWQNKCEFMGKRGKEWLFLFVVL